MEALKEVTPCGKLETERERLSERAEYLRDKIERFSDQGLNTFMIAMELAQIERSLKFIARVRGD